MRSKYCIHYVYVVFLNVIIDVTIEGEFVYTVFAAIYTLIKLKWPPVNLIITNLMLALALIND